MLTIKEIGLLQSIIKHCEKIIEKTKGVSKEDFCINEDLIQIICFNILQIGELAKNFDKQFVQTYNQVPWRLIKGMRDKVAHGYGTIDIDRVWGTAQKDIKPLKEYCLSILK